VRIYLPARAQQWSDKVEKQRYKSVLRIRDVYPGSGFFPILDPDFSGSGSATLISFTILEKFEKLNIQTLFCININQT